MARPVAALFHLIGLFVSGYGKIPLMTDWISATYAVQKVHEINPLILQSVLAL